MTARRLPGNGESITLTAAATGEPFASYADPGAEGANAILESSSAGAAAWGAINGFERAAILRNVSRVVEAHAEELAILESATTGKPIRDARVEAAKVAEMFGYYSGWADKLTGQTIPVPGLAHLHRTRPVGRRRRHHALERSAVHGRLELRRTRWPPATP